MIERVIYTEEADDDVAESCHWYESHKPGLGEDSFVASRHVSLPSSGIHISIPSPWMSSAGRSCVAFPLRYSTSRLPTPSSFTQFSIALKTRRSGGRGLAPARNEATDRVLARMTRGR
jgi:hypothetical protein